MLLFIKKLLLKIDADRAVVFGLLAKIWNIFSRFVIAILIATKFTPVLQGYYYTFENLLALQIFIELGFGSVIVPFASHEWSQLGLDKTGNITGDKNSLSRLVSLAHITFRWYLVGGLALVLVLVLLGYLFFSHSQNAGISWMWPWMTLSFFTGTALCLVPIWSLLEGCNQVTAVYMYRFIQAVFLSFSIFFAIFFGAKLWTASISSLIILVLSFIFLRARYWNYLKTLLFAKPSGSIIRWRLDILPMQWRVALSWISSYFSYYLFTPILFKYHGSVIAGQMGMTWSFVASLVPISTCWLFPKVPRFGILIAQRRYEELDRLFYHITKIVIAIASLGAVAIWSLVFMLNIFDHPLASRFLPPFQTGIFLLAQLLLSASVPFSSYLRSHKKEPLLYLSLITGVLIALSTVFLGKRYSATGMAFGYLIINTILIPILIIIWYKCKLKWHNGLE